MQRPTPERTDSRAPGLRSPARLAGVFERTATTVAVLVVSVAVVTRRHPPEARTAALAGLWSGMVALAGMLWVASTVVSAAHRLGHRRPDKRAPQDRFLERLAVVRVFPPLGSAPSPASAVVEEPGRRTVTARAARRPRGDRRQLLRAGCLVATSAAVAWSAAVLGSTWQPLCAGLVEGLAVATAYRVFRVLRPATYPRRRGLSLWFDETHTYGADGDGRALSLEQMGKTGIRTSFVKQDPRRAAARR